MSKRYFVLLGFAVISFNLSVLCYSLVANGHAIPKKNLEDTSAVAFGQRPLALVWNGTGACKEECATAAAKVARAAGYYVRYQNEKNFDPALLTKAKVWVQPGGDGIEAAKAMGSEKLAAIRSYVHAGGAYVGFCAGAFLADKWVDDFNTVEGLGITPVTTTDFGKDKLAGKDIILDVKWEGHLRHLYFSDGASFKPNPNADIRIIAEYDTPGLPIEPAVWENKYGAGTVILSGPHPEAPDDWKENLDNKDADGDDSDLAEELFVRAIREI